MSGCHPPYVEMPVCEHLVPFKYTCLECNRTSASPLVQEIQELKKQVRSLIDMYKHLSVQVASYQDHKIRQIDENRKVSKRLDEIEETLKTTNKFKINYDKDGSCFISF